VKVASLRIDPLGDSAVIVSGSIAEEWADPQIRTARANALIAHRISGVTEVSTAFKSLSIYFDCRLISFQEVQAWILAVLSDNHLSASIPGGVRRFEIPVCYDVVFGLDLPRLSESLQMPKEEIVERHSTAQYRVEMIGFSPGFPYLSGLPAELHIPRRPTPRLRVPGGSVAIAGNQAGIYPNDSPGGWHIVGRTGVRLFDIARTPPCILQAGDVVRFVPITGHQLEALSDVLETDPWPESTS
jgi:KipI family sensor histidine kinase inhibitor